MLCCAVLCFRVKWDSSLNVDAAGAMLLPTGPKILCTGERCVMGDGSSRGVVGRQSSPAGLTCEEGCPGRSVGVTPIPPMEKTSLAAAAMPSQSNNDD